MEQIKIDIEKIMEELRKKAAKRRCEREAADFDIIIHSERELSSFDSDSLKENLSLLNTQCQVEYDISITGKGRFIKKVIRKLYRFHMKPLWDKQNEINTEVVAALRQMKNYVNQSIAIQEEQEREIASLKMICASNEKQGKGWENQAEGELE